VTLREDYRITLQGELDAGAPDTIRTRLGAFGWAFRRLLNIFRRLNRVAGECRDCMEIAVSNDVTKPDYCNACEGACGPEYSLSAECQAEGAYGG